MKIIRNIEVPTGNILVVKGEHGFIEMLSLGDYGKEINLKCDAMGLSREIGRVTHTKLLPLEEKWVITISTQYGCSMGCSFCDVPKVGHGKARRGRAWHGEAGRGKAGQGKVFKSPKGGTN